MWEYPAWEVPRIGGGMIVAAIATAHVLVAHFSVGAGVLLAVGERRARRLDDPVLLDFLKLYSKFLLLIGFVFGAVSGVGIWFSISIVATRATSTLIHNFVWFWAIEWVFFLVEIAAGYAYYLTWDKVSPKNHLRLAYIYAVSAWMSLLVISGILSFMLSPGRWLETGNIWDGFLNPTFWPTVGLRTLSSLSIAGLVAIAIANLPKTWSREDRTHVINFSAWFLSPLVLMAPFAYGYFKGVPEPAQNLLEGGAAAMTLFFLFGIAASTLVGAYAYLGLIRAKRYVNWETALLLLSIAVIATVSMEFVREGIRKPYLIYGRQYSNGFAPDEVPEIDRRGVLASAPWYQLHSAKDVGRTLYQIQCAGCHVVGGFNDLAPVIRGWSRELLAYNLDRLPELKHFMPPVVGTREEREKLVDYLMKMKSADTPTSTAASEPQDGSRS